MDHIFIAVHYFVIIWMMKFQVIFFFFCPPPLSALLPEFPVTSPFPLWCVLKDQNVYRLKDQETCVLSSGCWGQDKNCESHRKTSSSPATHQKRWPPLEGVHASIRLLSSQVLLPSKNEISSHVPQAIKLLRGPVNFQTFIFLVSPMWLNMWPTKYCRRGQKERYVMKKNTHGSKV